MADGHQFNNILLGGRGGMDVSNLTSYMTNTMGVTPEEKHLSISGRNWGEVNLEGNMLTFLVGSRQAFELSLADVSQTQLQGKNEVVLEFHVDDTTGANEKDTLMELSFHIPNTNTTFAGDDTTPPAQVFREKIMSMADVGPSGAEAVALFEDIAILTPRGRYTVELHISFLRLQGQANDFKIQFSSVIRLFMLPKSPHTLVVITLDPPIRKGQTFYPHIVLQFAMEEIAECALSMNEELLNTKYKDKLEPSYKGLSHEVFTQILRGLSGAKVTRPGKFRSSQDGYAVRASLKAEDGILYPLEKSFFFLPKPPTLVLHDEIEYLEFERHGAAGTSSMSSHYFDLHIRLKSEQEHQFRNIQRNEYHNLFNFINSKGLKIMNLGDGQGTGGVASVLENSDDEAVDPHLERIKNAIDAGGGEESDEEDEDFVAEKDDAGSPTEGSEEEESDASESAENKERVAKKEVKKKEATAPKVTATKRKKKDEEEDGGKKRKQKKKKDPNAPKRAMSGFMFFSQIERENIKKNNPGMPFTEVAKALGERWKKMSVEEKEPFESKARADQKRYKNAMADYKSGPTNNIDSGNESDSE
ncbi:FACT complex subunit SSRP1 isoform X3 [Cryptomeria japonica]|uniref:FACT complex subunit SSRP1 isoform X3 n=1 Tax=Cryptomeria japonica TaxID=3369 RepID=UPI0025AD837D|nr:FACT complex subunit SSRP1 isoform X3 [Cryptomeria japonica]